VTTPAWLFYINKVYRRQPLPGGVESGASPCVTKHPDALEALYDHVRQCDVFVTNFLPGARARHTATRSAR
jgi:hypothetical protein